MRNYNCLSFTLGGIAALVFVAGCKYAGAGAGVSSESRERGAQVATTVDRKGIDRAFLDALLRMKSETQNVQACNDCLDFVEARLKSKGLCTFTARKENGRKALYASVTPGLEHDYVFVSHVDIVPALEPDQFEPRVEGDWLWARGACDTKGNVAVICAALERLAGSGASVGAVIVTDEESGDGLVGSPQVLRDAGVKPRKFIMVGDSAGEEPNQLFIAEKGHAKFTMVAHGKGGHSSRPWDLDNPVPKLCEGLQRLQAALPAPEDPNEHWRDVLTPTVLNGGPRPNVVPDTASMVFSFRYTRPDSVERMLKLMREASGLEVIPPSPNHRKPVLNRADDPEIAALFAAMQVKWPAVRQGKMSAATDATYFADMGLPIVVFAATGYDSHGSTERISLKSLDEYADMFTDFLKSRKE